MKKNLLFVVCFLSLMSCAKDEALRPEKQTITVDYRSIDEANALFASVLAKAVQDPAVAVFIKDKALKEVDKDNDVIYHFVKNEPLSNGMTFRETLAGYSGGLENLDKITAADPTLTIQVPYLGPNFNAEEWNPEMQKIVGIALRNAIISKETKELRYFNAAGNESHIKRYERPTEPTLVVKSNERLTTTVTKGETNPENALQNDEGTFAYFLFDEYNNIAKTKALWPSTQAFMDRCEKDIYAFFRTPNSQRDYIYYGIDQRNQETTGAFNNSYAEYLTAIRFHSDISYPIIADVNDPTGDWSDGAFEFYIDVIFNRRNGGTFNLRKVLHIATSDMFYISNDKKTAIGGGYYRLPTPLELFTWDMYEYGDTYKIAVQEYDPGTTITRTTSMSSTFSANFESSTEVGIGVVKVGAKSGTSQTTSNSSQLTINTTNTSDDLGEVFINFSDPVYPTLNTQFDVFSTARGIAYMTFEPTEESEKKLRAILDDPNVKVRGFGQLTNQYDTGVIQLTITPMRKQ